VGVESFSIKWLKDTSVVSIYKKPPIKAGKYHQTENAACFSIGAQTPRPLLFLYGPATRLICYSAQKSVSRRGGRTTRERPKVGGESGAPQILSLLFFFNKHPSGDQMKLRHKVPITARLGVIGFASKVEVGPKVNYFDPLALAGLTSHVDVG
jgi:hypothetical protein